MAQLISRYIVHYYQLLSSILTWTVVFQTLIVTLLLRFIYSQFIYINYMSPLRKMPSTNFVPFFGCILDLQKMEIYEYAELWFQKLKAPMFRFYWLLGKERVSISDADIAKQIFVNKSKSYAKPDETYNVLRHMLGNGLATSEGDIHRRNKKLCNNFFKFNLLKKVVPFFDQEIGQLIDRWLKDMDNTHHRNDKESFMEFTLEKEMADFTLDIIGKFAFEYDFNAIKHSDDEITHHFQHLNELFKLSPSFILFSLFPSINTSYAIKHKKMIAKADEVIYPMIKQKRKELADISDESRATSLLASLIMTEDEETGDKMDDKQIRDEIMTFMVAGHETTGITLNWCLLEAARHPEAQQKIRDEAASVITPGTELSSNDIEKMTYTKCFIQETLRLYPPAVNMARGATEDNYLDGYLITKGTIAMIEIGIIQRNPKYWDEPNEFRPERFLDPSTIYPYSFLPFIAGSRMCIGYKFAMLEMATALARLMTKFQFETIPGVTYKRAIVLTLRPEPALVLRVRKIE